MPSLLHKQKRNQRSHWERKARRAQQQQRAERDVLTGAPLVADAMHYVVVNESVPLILALRHAATTGTDAAIRRDLGSAEMAPAFLNYFH